MSKATPISILSTPTWYRFVFDDGENYGKWFTVSPVTNILHAGEKSQAVSITFKPDKELTFKDESILICHVSEWCQSL